MAGCPTFPEWDPSPFPRAQHEESLLVMLVERVFLLCNFLGSISKRAPPFLFLITIKCLGAAWGLAIPRTNPRSCSTEGHPSSQNFPSRAHQPFQQMENWSWRKPRLMVPLAAAAWCSGEPSRHPLPQGWRGLTINGAGREAFISP